MMWWGGGSQEVQFVNHKGAESHLTHLQGSSPAPGLPSHWGLPSGVPLISTRHSLLSPSEHFFRHWSCFLLACNPGWGGGHDRCSLNKVYAWLFTSTLCQHCYQALFFSEVITSHLWVIHSCVQLSCHALETLNSRSFLYLDHPPEHKKY